MINNESTETSFERDLSRLVGERQQAAYEANVLINPEFIKLRENTDRLWDAIQEKAGEELMNRLYEATNEINSLIYDAYYLQGLKDGMDFKSIFG